MILVFTMAFSKSYYTLNLDNQSFVTAIGIDTSDTNNMKVTFEFVNIASSDNSSLSSSDIILNTVDSSSINDAINIMNAYIGKKVNLSNCKVFIFSEKYAENGISDEVFTLINDIQVRPTANIVVSKCNAKYYIEHSAPNLENLVTKYYDILPPSSEYTGYSFDATIGQFFNNLKCNACQQYAILGGITTNSSNSTQTDDMKSNTTPISGIHETDSLGLGVFKDGKIVGELNALESICFSCLLKDTQSFQISIANPEKENSLIDIALNVAKNKKVKVNIVNGSPYVKIKLQFEGKVASMSKDSKYLDENTLDTISEETSHYLEKAFSNFLYKTSTEYDSDVCSIGKYAFPKFWTLRDFENYNWNSNYKNSVFDVEVITDINSSFIINQS